MSSKGKGKAKLTENDIPIIIARNNKIIIKILNRIYSGDKTDATKRLKKVARISIDEEPTVVFETVSWCFWLLRIPIKDGNLDFVNKYDFSFLWSSKKNKEKKNKLQGFNPEHMLNTISNNMYKNFTIEEQNEVILLFQELINNAAKYLYINKQLTKDPKYDNYDWVFPKYKKHYKFINKNGIILDTALKSTPCSPIKK
jgi:hypothetical protein